MSSIAVFLILGGATAFAAKKIGSNEIKGNSITTGKIKKEAVSAAKIKKNSITTAKISDGAVTGAKVNLGSLGTVPSATNAVHATNADNATNWSRYFTTGVVKATAGQNVPLFNIGPFSAVGHCKDLGSGEYEATTFITTTQTGSSMSAYYDAYMNADFNPGTEAQIAYPITGTTPESSYDFNPGQYNSFAALSADGKTILSGESNNAVHYFGAACAFWDRLTNDG
jgi:hypothetical protein